ncbi:MAG: PKD-like domain-containing protein [Bacteroidota bacterium]|nr:PKD-like domain-containing protein [Bacteroidota bacterium]
MKKSIFFIFLLFIVFTAKVSAQVPGNNSCFSPVSISPSASCNVTSGTTTNATQSYAGCSGTADDDVWYSFVATTTTAYITVYPSSGFDAVIGLHGSCTATSLACRDINPSGVEETMTYSSLTIGNTYLVRVYHFGAGAGTGNFNICITTGAVPSAPANNICSSATSLNINPVCSNTAGTTFSANQSFASGCGAGNADDDVWYSFIATAATNTITLAPSSGFDAVIELHDYCTATNMACADVNSAGGSESLIASSLTPGATYLVRVYHYGVGSGSGAFNICVTGPAAPSAPANDNPCGAIALPAVTTNCNYGTYSNAFATETSTALAPAPSACTGGIADGGYSTDVIEDVWFSVVVPSTGLIHVQAYPNVSGNFVTDAAMALYTGSSCSALTQVACSDDNNYPGSTYDLLPVLRVPSLTPGTTVYIRYWSTADTDPGDFGLCVTTATNDACSSALYVCDLNGYSATTSSAFTVDRPGTGTGQMFGNNEVWDASILPSGDWTSNGGVNSGGPFGDAPSFNASGGSPFIDVEIDNNSWVKFTAGAATATFTVTISNCWINKGVQMQIFSSNNCDNFVPVSVFKEGATNYTLSAQGLVPYQDYYLMVDGWGGDICNYTIAALSGVLFPEITASSAAVCANTPVTLTGPAGASSYLWNTSATTPTITVSPSVTTTYSLTVTGVCGATQNLTKTVTVYTTPDITSSSTATALCSGQAMNHALTSTVASTYSWTPVANTNVGGETAGTSSTINNTLTNTTTSDQTVVYDVIPYSSTGNCPGAVEQVSVIVRPRPQLTDPADINVCAGSVVSSTNFTSDLAGTNYSWTASNSSTIVGLGTNGTGNISGTAQLVAASTNFTVTPTSTDGCTGPQQTFSVTVKPKPIITAVSSNTYCGNSTVPAVAFVSNPATSVNWISSGTNTGLSIASGSNSISSFTSADVTTVTTSTISLDANLNGCDANQEQYTITVNPLPQLSAAPSMVPSGCGLSDGALTINPIDVTATGTIHYSWTNSSNTVVGSDNPSLTNQPAGSYNVTITDNFNCPKTFGPYSIINPGAPNIPTVSVTGGDVAKCEGEAIELTGTSAGLTTGTYAWSGPNGVTSITNTLTINSSVLANSGTYTLTVTENNCTSNNTINITVNANPLPTASSDNATYCSGGNINLFGTSASSYSWTGPNGFVSSNQNPTINPSTTLETGTYSLTVTDANNCTGQATTSLTVNQTPADPVTTGSSNALCEGDTLKLFANSTGATSYAWIGPNVFISNDQNPTIVNANENNEGVYTIVATANGCNSIPAFVNVIVNPNPNVIVSASPTVACSGEDITLTASGATTIVWDYQTTSGGTLQLNDVLVSNTGYYPVEITDGNGCMDRDSVLITVNQTPGTPLISSPDAILCVGEDLQLNANSTGAISYSWTGPNAFSSSQQNPTLTNVNVTQAGVYTVNASANNCTSIDTTIIIAVNSMPVANASASNTLVCSGSDVTLFGSGGTTYAWTGPNSFNSSLQNPDLLSASTLQSGTYSLTVTDNNCSTNTTVDIVINQTPGTPVITVNPAALCEGDDFTLSANSTDAISYSWTGPAGFNSTNQSNTINNSTVLNVGTYTVSATALNCTSPTQTVDVVINPTPIATAAVSVSTICSGNSADLTSTGGTTFSWTGPNGYTSSQANNTLTNVDVTATGTYTFTAINPGNCTDMATVSLVVNETPAAAVAIGDSTCIGNSLTLTATGTGTINWYDDAALTNLVATGGTLNPNLATNTSGIYYVTVSNSGCTSTTNTVVAANYNINASFNASAVSGYAPLPVVFTNTSTGVDASDTYSWLISNSQFATTYNSAYDFTQGGTFNVDLIITDSPSGCVDTASVTIVIDDEIRVVIPNIFTPNGDGVNDGFTLDIKGGKEAEGTIFNRWGQVLYTWDALNVVWDGKVPNGEKVSDGVYFYIIKVTGYDGKVLDVPGNVTIVR